jgi:hypothetical protein
MSRVLVLVDGHNVEGNFECVGYCHKLVVVTDDDDEDDDEEGLSFWSDDLALDQTRHSLTRIDPNHTPD